MANLDPATVRGFGDEWNHFDQSGASDEELRVVAERYFSLLPLDSLTGGLRVLDVGCGSGRWARLVAPLVADLHALDPARAALDVARRNLAEFENVSFHEASVDNMPVAENSMDLVYSLGVLHHVPDTSEAIRQCVARLKSGGRFLIYVYYRFDNRPWWFQAVWKLSDLMRCGISRLPFRLKRLVTDLIACFVYWPLARIARWRESTGRNFASIPLSIYRDSSFYTLRTDALDRFGTRLEKRFTRSEIEKMLTDAGLVDIKFRENEPYWCAVGVKP